jgi:hypothetical protein
MTNSTSITVLGKNIRVQNEEYICLTDMAKNIDNPDLATSIVKNWLRNISTVDFLATWESIHNPIFKVLQLEQFRKDVKEKRTFNLSTWTNKIDAIGIYVRQGHQGGIFAHKDIAIKFGASISQQFEIYLIKEFQRLKDEEKKNYHNAEWNVRRVMSKMAYAIQTDAIKECRLPDIDEKKHHFIYAQEGDLLNRALFGFTAKQWRESYPELANKFNARDFSSVNELTCLTMIEGINAELIRQQVPFKERFARIKEIVQQQLNFL